MDVNSTSLHNKSIGMDNGIFIYPAPTVISLIVINTVFCVLGTVGNTLVLLAVIKNPALQTIQDLFIFSLSVADLLVSGFKQPLLVYKASVNFQVFSHTLLIVLDEFSNLSSPAAVTCMFAVTLDRFIAIRYPFSYMLHCTKKRAMLVILFCWVISMVINTATSLVMNARYLLWVYVTVSLIATVAIYIYLFRTAQKQQNRIVTVQPLDEQRSLPDVAPSNHQNEERKATNTNNQSRDRKGAKTIALVVGVYTLLYLPFLLYTISHASDLQNPEKLVGFYWFFSFWLVNSAVDPYIYCARSSRYRRAFKAILKLHPRASIMESIGTGTAG